MLEFPIDQILSETLETDAVLGGDEGTDQFVVQCSDQPIGLNLRTIFEKLGKPVPEECKLYDAYDVWLIPHRISILRRRGVAEPISVGMSVEYVHGEQTCSIVSLLPEFQFVRQGHLGAEVGIKGLMSVTGEAEPTDDMGDFDALKAGEGLAFGLTAGGAVGFQLSASVCKAVVAAVGKGSSRCEWVFVKQGTPLHGRDLETWAIVVLPKRQTELAYRLKVFYTTRTLFFPTRRESQEAEIRCKLTR